MLPFVSVPEGKVFGNQKSAFVHSSFVTESIRELLQNGCINQVNERPVVCSPLLVALSSSGKKRLVINLRYVNSFLHKEKFKYEDMRTALTLFEKGEYIATFDLKSGYHHVDIHEQSQEFLGFAWSHKYYVFTVLPFGLATACYVFTKLMRPLVRLWRSKGIKCVVYLDDGIIITAGFEKACLHSSLVRESLESAGFVVNAAKSHWEPQRGGQWLGFNINLESGSISVPAHKIDSLRDLIEQANCERTLPAKLLASIVGKIMSMGLGLGPIVRLRTRCMYALLNNRVSWYSDLHITKDAKEELTFWQNCIVTFNGQKLWKSPSAVRVVYSDASSTGFAGYTVEHGTHVAHGQWTETERNKSSTWRELSAVARVLEAVSSKLSNHRVRWFTDNQNVVRIIRVGSRVSELQEEALRIFKTMLYNNICIEPEWIPREQNVIADSLSRIIDYDDWSINPSTFMWLDSFWGPHTIDRFADSHNTQLDRFNSRFWDVGTEAVDTFTVNWANENNWWCPPVYLVCRTLQHAKVCKSQGTLIVPLWKSAPFWPILCPSEDVFADFIHAWVELPLIDLILPGRSGGAIPVSHSGALALRINFSINVN